MDIGKIIGDKPQQEDGAWIPFNEDKSVEFLLVYSDSRKPRNFFTAGFSKLRRKARGGIPPVDKQQELTIDMLVLHVVKGWKGLEQKNSEGKLVPFEYSEANCRKLLTESSVIRDFVAGEAGDIENFGAVLDAEEIQEGGPNGEMKSGAPVES